MFYSVTSSARASSVGEKLGPWPRRHFVHRELELGGARPASRPDGLRGIPSRAVVPAIGIRQRSVGPYPSRPRSFAVSPLIDRRKPQLGGTRDDPAPVAGPRVAKRARSPRRHRQLLPHLLPAGGRFFDRGYSGILRMARTKIAGAPSRCDQPLTRQGRRGARHRRARTRTSCRNSAQCPSRERRRGRRTPRRSARSAR